MLLPGGRGAGQGRMTRGPLTTAQHLGRTYIKHVHLGLQDLAEQPGSQPCAPPCHGHTGSPYPSLPPLLLWCTPHLLLSFHHVPLCLQMTCPHHLHSLGYYPHHVSSRGHACCQPTHAGQWQAGGGAGYCCGAHAAHAAAHYTGALLALLSAFLPRLSPQTPASAARLLDA